MKQRRTTTSPQYGLRRVFACFLTLVGLWMLTLTGPGYSLLQAWGGNAYMVTAALAAQLTPGVPLSEPAPNDLFLRLLLGESPLLAGFDRNQDSTPISQAEFHGEEETDTELKTPSGTSVVEKFFSVTSPEDYSNLDGVYILNRTSKSLDMKQVGETPVTLRLGAASEPQVLIMHTHGSEAYTQDGEDVYSETDPARTIDSSYNIIRVGDEIERIFTGMGLNVLHDETLYDYPNYNGSYDRSKVAVEQYLAEYPSIKIVLDVHRDALVGEDGTIYKAVTEIDGAKTAQVLMVMGSDDGGLSHPKWQENLSLAMRIQHRMNTLWPGLARPIALRSSRFNQQLTTGSILVEVGSHGNTLQEALAGARLFARAAGQVLLELRE